MYDRLTASQNIRLSASTVNSLHTENQVDFEEREIQEYAQNSVLKKKDDNPKKKVLKSEQNKGAKNPKKKKLKAKSQKK